MTTNTNQTTLKAWNYSARYAKGHTRHRWLQVDLSSAIQSQASMRGICGGQNGDGASCAASISAFPRQNYATTAPHSFISITDTKMLCINSVLNAHLNNIKTPKSRFLHFIKIQDFWEVRTCRVANTYRRFE